MKFFLGMALAVGLSAGSAATAATVGVAVKGDGLTEEVLNQPMGSSDFPDNTSAMDLANLAGTGTDAIIGFYNPLSGSDCTFGVGNCGLVSDKGLGGTKMTMWLFFEDYEGGKAEVNFYFEDQDFLGANDPDYFREALHLYEADGSPLLDITDINVTYPGVTVAGDSDTQTVVSVGLGHLAAGDHWLKVGFSSEVDRSGYGGWKYDKCEKYGHYCPRNTPENMIVTMSVVPLPAAAWMFLSGLGLLAAVGRRKRLA